MLSISNLEFLEDVETDLVKGGNSGEATFGVVTTGGITSANTNPENIGVEGTTFSAFTIDELGPVFSTLSINSVRANPF